MSTVRLSAVPPSMDKTGKLLEADNTGRGFRVMAGALFWRAWREQRWRVLLVFMGSLLFSAALSAVVLYAPTLLTGSTQAALQRMVEAHPELRQNTSAPLLAAFLLGQGPFLLAIFAAAAAGNVTRSMIAYDVERGGFEVLLSAPYPPGMLFGAYLMAALALTGLTWGSVALPSIGVAAAVSLYKGLTIGHLTVSIALGVVTSVAMAVWASTATMFATIKAPGLMGVQSGASSAIPQLVSVLPGVVVFGVLNVLPGVNLLIFGLIALGVSLICAVLASAALGVEFRVARLLASH